MSDNKKRNMNIMEDALIKQLGFEQVGDHEFDHNGIDVSLIVNRYTGNYDLVFNAKKFHEVLLTLSIWSDEGVLELNYHGFNLRIDDSGDAEVFDENEEDSDVAGYGKTSISKALELIQDKIHEARDCENIDDLPFPKDGEPASSPLEKLMAEWAVWCFRCGFMDSESNYSPSKVFTSQSSTSEQRRYVQDYRQRWDDAEAKL